MAKVKLLTSYLNQKAGEILETDQIKCQELVNLGRAEWIENEVKLEIKKEGYSTTILRPKKRGRKRKIK